MIAIIGAGISGLSLAYELQKAGKSYILFESSSRTGGYIHSKRLGNYLIEVGPNSILMDKAFEDFISEIGLKNEITLASPVNKNRFIYKNGRIQKVPSGPLSLLFSNFLSFKTKKAIFSELNNKSDNQPDESIYDFFSRHFNKEIADYIVDPFTTGVYAGDAKQLLIQDTFPALYDFEKNYGSIIKGVLKKGFGERRKTGSLSNGLQTISDTIESKLNHIKLNNKVIDLNLTQSSIDLTIQNQLSQSIEMHSFHKVVFCGTTFHAADLLTKTLPDISWILNQVHYAPVKAVYAAFKKSDVKHTMQGFGALYPSIENSFLAGTIWNSSIFSDRCPSDEVLTTSFIGGIKHPEYTRLTDQELETRAIAQLKKDLKINGEPTFVFSAGWERAIPQYDINLRKAKQAIAGLQDKNVYFSSNWSKSITLGNCIQNARELALAL